MLEYESRRKRITGEYQGLIVSETWKSSCIVLSPSRSLVRISQYAFDPSVKISCGANKDDSDEVVIKPSLEKKGAREPSGSDTDVDGGSLVITYNNDGSNIAVLT